MLRVATLNLLHSHDALRERVEQLIGQLIAESLDYLLLQEVLPKDASGYSAVEHLAGALSLPHVLHSQGEGAPSGNTILSKYPLTPIPLEPGTFYPDRLPTIAESTVAGRRVVVMSYHGAWGPHATADRLVQLRVLDDVARQEFTRERAHLNRDTRPVIILGGDFNAVPDSQPIRFITGLEQVLGHSTLWVDATGDVGHTAGEPNVLSLATAAGMPGAGYRPERQPRRRIDYLFVYEWAYGQAGEPNSAQRIADVPFITADGRKMTVSDHFGVMAELWMPQRD